MIFLSLHQLATMCQGELINSKDAYKVKGVYINTREHQGEDIFIPIIGDNLMDINM